MHDDPSYRKWKSAVQTFCDRFFLQYADGVMDAGPDEAASLMHKHSIGMFEIIGENTFADDVASMSKCRAGCSRCCRGNIEAAWYESANIARFIIWAEERGELPPTADAVERHADLMAGMDGAGRLASDSPCPFLADDLCSIYGVRPILCRAVWATQDSSCDSGGEHMRKLFAPIAAAKLVTETLLRMRQPDPPLPPTSELSTAVRYHLRRMRGETPSDPPLPSVGREDIETDTERSDGWNVSGE